MSLSAAAIRLLVEKGMSAEDIAQIAEAMDTPAPALSPGAIRTRRWRENKDAASRGDVTVTRHGDVSHVGECAQVVVLSSSLRSEEKIPPEKPSVSTPKGADASRGTRLPDGWRPDEAGHRYAVEQLGVNVDPERELDRFRDYWRAVPGAKGRKADWPATWRNWVRRAAENLPGKLHERPRPDSKLAARQANLARAFAGSESAALRRREH